MVIENHLVSKMYTSSFVYWLNIKHSVDRVKYLKKEFLTSLSSVLIADIYEVFLTPDILKVTIRPRPIENIIPQTEYSVDIKKLSGCHSMKVEQVMVNINIVTQLNIWIFTFYIYEVATHLLKKHLFI